MIDNQTKSENLQKVSSDEAAKILNVPIEHLRYTAWPQVVHFGGKSEIVTGEAWIYAPAGRLDDDEPHPAVVFNDGNILGTVSDLDCIGGYLATHRGRAQRKTLGQVTGFVERRTYPRRGIEARNTQLADVY